LITPLTVPDVEVVYVHAMLLPSVAAQTDDGYEVAVEVIIAFCVNPELTYEHMFTRMFDVPFQKNGVENGEHSMHSE